MLYDHPRIPVRSQMEMGYCKMHPPAHDIISNLPDCMLHHILSFLPTKDAVATCILSTRWRYLWAALSTLDLDDDLVYFTDKSWYLYERPSFMNFVERVLIHRDVPRMKKFRLCCRVCLWAPRVSAWISAAVRHGVQELDLLLVLEKEFVLPRCVFTSDRLRVLKLAMECSLTLPPAVFLPNLKSLQLFFMTFSDESSFHRLFSGCPGLEELRMVDCDWKKLKNVAITAPTLKNLAIDFGYDSSDCVIKVQAPNLVSLTLFGYLLNEVSLVNRLSLVDASIEVLGPYHKQFETARHTVKLLERLQSVKFLSISTGTIMALFEAKLSLFHLPVFHNLTHLEIAMTVEGHSLETLVEFLQGLPCLEYLSFPEGFSPCSRLCQGDWALKPSLRCSLPRLKTINLWFTRGNYVEISILKFLVESAPVLGRITISLKKTICPEWEKEKICAELKTLCGVKGCDVVLLI